MTLQVLYYVVLATALEISLQYSPSLEEQNENVVEKRRSFHGNRQGIFKKTEDLSVDFLHTCVHIFVNKMYVQPQRKEL